MTHPEPGTLPPSHGPSRTVDIGETASQPPEATAPGVLAITGPIWPRQVTDRYDRVWTWVRGYSCYRYDGSGTHTIFSDPEPLRDQDGPLYLVSDVNEIIHPDLAQYNLDVRRTTPAVGNAFEWAWEHSRAEGLARAVLLTLAWDADPYAPTPWPGYTHLWIHTGTDVDPNHKHTRRDLDPVADAVVELAALDELGIQLIDRNACIDYARSSPLANYVLPGYQRWMTEHEVAW